MGTTRSDLPDRIGSYRVLESIGVAQRLGPAGLLLAVKQIVVSEERRAQLAKEVLIHQCLRHENIVRFVEAFEEGQNFCIVQELAVGGELFERIEPDVGFPEQVAHFYFVQLKYLKECGVCHRDLKPENLLLDGCGNLKLADFGLATVFMKDARRRRLATRCGTPAYMAPEVCMQAYEGDDADLWSSCIILYTMLTGSLPWEHATKKSREFMEHVQAGRHEGMARLPDGSRGILDGVLQMDPRQRWTIERVMADPWFTQRNTLFDGEWMCACPAELARLIKMNMSTQFTRSLDLPLTQPELFRGDVRVGGMLSLSQPAEQCMRESTEHASFVRNSFARFMCSAPVAGVFRRLVDVLQTMVVPFKASDDNSAVYFYTVDRRKNPLVGSIVLQVVGDSVLVGFQKSRGSPIEFARFFKIVADQCVDML